MATREVQTDRDRKGHQQHRIAIHTSVANCTRGSGETGLWGACGESSRDGSRGGASGEDTQVRGGGGEDIVMERDEDSTVPAGGESVSADRQGDSEGVVWTVRTRLRNRWIACNAIRVDQVVCTCMPKEAN